MIYLLPGLIVTPEPNPNLPGPLPNHPNGFTIGMKYKVLGVHAPSETSEAYLIISNNRNELWFIPNRQLRVVPQSPTPPEDFKPI